ncbi:DGQHR domain-containing protein [Desulfallas sp. Bu1-1]|uniref:DNA sulfur modification protein DndB n=1 Tax=Desulfallas sp. Bu1-1 TaxID=2787620 RepID=UPI00189F9E2A|nr:DNA sulfur modification protein DndB [Desulfallas sp. Bu1-1]MBF7081857.1 DGQHR domain-containing protein [Desulfallas sp. Bu1-1]
MSKAKGMIIKMKIPAIRAQIGTWIYYVATLTFKEVATYVKRVDSELHRSELLQDMLQRSITSNYKSIASYIENQEERFFNALILAVYDGEPVWHEVRLEYDDGDEFYNLGILELNGEEKIFPVDGQHRVEGIKKVLEESRKYDDEKIPVVFIGHKTDAEGMQRSRRLFSTLNRYAKPVSMRDIIALDEDDVVAIVSRDLIESHPLFANGRVLDSKTKAIPDSNTSAFTTIIAFYECNKELLWLFIKDIDVLNIEGNKVRGRAKIKEYIRIRPTDEDINKFKTICQSFWGDLINCFTALYDYSLMDIPDSREYRNRNGGLLLFRPVALIPFVRATVRVVQSKGTSFREAFSQFPSQLLHLNNTIWRNILWNADKRTMIMNNKTLTERILIYFWDRAILTDKELIDMKEDLRSLRQLSDMHDVEDLLDSAIEVHSNE